MWVPLQTEYAKRQIALVSQALNGGEVYTECGFFPRAHGEMYAMIAVSSSRYNTQADVLALQKDEDGMQAPV